MLGLVDRKALAGIQYMGSELTTQSCIRAIVRLICYGDDIQKVKLLTYENRHCFLLDINEYETIAIKGGFTSGYPGEGPKGLSTALRLLERHADRIYEFTISKEAFQHINSSCFLLADLEKLDKQTPVLPERWHDYINDALQKDKTRHDVLRKEFPVTIPYALVDDRIVDLALKFEQDPDSALLSGYRRLEAIVKTRTGLTDQHGAKLFSSSFQNENSILYWEHIDKNESIGRGRVFPAVFMGFRNRRAHKESESNPRIEVREFLLLNELFLLESEAVERPTK